MYTIGCCFTVKFKSCDIVILFWFKSNTHLTAETLIQCVNAKEGCDWKGTLAKLDTHKHVCLYRSVQCPKCFKLIKRYELETHLSKDCTGRTVPCLNAEAGGKWTGRFTDLATYRETCDRNSVQCPEECGELIKVQSLHHHTSEGSERHTVCPNEGKDCLGVGQASNCGRVTSFEDQRKDHFHTNSVEKYKMMNLNSTVDAHVAPLGSISKIVDTDRYFEDVTPVETLLAKLEKKRRIDLNKDRRKPEEKENVKHKKLKKPVTKIKRIVDESKRERTDTDKDNIELKKDTKEALRGMYLKSKKLKHVVSQFELTFPQFDSTLPQFDSTLAQFEFTSPQLKLTFHNYTFKQYIPPPFVGNKFLQEIEQQIFETRLKERIRERIKERIMIRLSRKQVQGVIDVSDVLQCLALVVSLGDETLQQPFVQFVYLMLQSKAQLSQKRDMLTSFFKLWEDDVNQFLNSEDESMENLLTNAGLNSPVSSAEPSDNFNEHTTNNEQYSLEDENLAQPPTEYNRIGHGPAVSQSVNNRELTGMLLASVYLNRKRRERGGRVSE